MQLKEGFLMTKNKKFRAVLTIFGTQKVLELRFDNLNENHTQIEVKPNYNSRHEVNEKEFINAFFNLTSAINYYTNHLKQKLVLEKILGMI